jgi:hypothetical protein
LGQTAPVALVAGALDWDRREGVPLALGHGDKEGSTPYSGDRMRVSAAGTDAAYPHKLTCALGALYKRQWPSDRRNSALLALPAGNVIGRVSCTFS